MKRRTFFVCIFLLALFSLFSWHFLKEKSSKQVPEKAVLVMDRNIKSTTVLIIK